MQEININSIQKSVIDLTLSGSLRKSEYDGLFYEHLYGLIQFDFISEKKNTFKESFGFDEYIGLEQFVLENTEIIEKSTPQEINWDLLDDARDILGTKIKQLLGKEAKSETLKPIIDFTIDSFENYWIYTMQHPDGKNNPWIYTDQVLHKGYLYLASDDKDLIRDYNPKIIEKADNAQNLGFIAKVKKEKEFSGFIIDNRLNSQSVVYEFLKQKASGYNYAKSKNQIISHLKSLDIDMSPNYLGYSILLPLKRAGMIGSSSTGFFYINDFNDLSRSYEFHKSKFKALERTLNMHEARARKMNRALAV